MFCFSRILVKDQPIFSTRDLGKEGKELASDFEQWQNEMHGFDESIKKANADSRLPPVRGTANITLGQQVPICDFVCFRPTF